MQELPQPQFYKDQSYPGTFPTYKAIRIAPKAAGSKGLAEGGKERLRVPEDCCKTEGEGCGCYYKDLKFHDALNNTGLTLSIDRAPSRFPLWIQAFRSVHSMNFTRLLVRSTRRTRWHLTVEARAICAPCVRGQQAEEHGRSAD